MHASPAPSAPSSSRQWRSRVFLALALLAGAAAVLFFVFRPSKRTIALSISAGSAHERRHRLAEILAEQAESRQLRLDLRQTQGSLDALQQVSEGRLDAALVQGGLGSQPHVTCVAALVEEPLHLLVRGDLPAGLESLRGKRLNLSTPGSGTRHLSLLVLDEMGLRPGEYIDLDWSYDKLRAAKPEELPDAVFVVSSLPAELARFLVNERGYRLLPLPFGEALNLRHAALREVTVPECTYRVLPPEPAAPLPTIGARLLLVAGEQVSEQAVTRMLETLFDSRFANAAELTGLDPHAVHSVQEFPPHPGTMAYLQRNEPLVTGENIEAVENLRNFIVSGFIAAFLAWRWWANRRAIGLERFLEDVLAVERQIQAACRAGSLTPDARLALGERLTQLKAEALEQYAAGRVADDEELNGFLAHLADARAQLAAAMSMSAPRA